MAETVDMTIIYEPGDDGWIVARIPDVAGVFSQGRTRDEACANVIDALRLMLAPEPGASDDGREREHCICCRCLERCGPERHLRSGLRQRRIESRLCLAAEFGGAPGAERMTRIKGCPG